MLYHSNPAHALSMYIEYLTYTAYTILNELKI